MTVAPAGPAVIRGPVCSRRPAPLPVAGTLSDPLPADAGQTSNRATVSGRAEAFRPPTDRIARGGQASRLSAPPLFPRTSSTPATALPNSRRCRFRRGAGISAALIRPGDVRSPPGAPYACDHECGARPARGDRPARRQSRVSRAIRSRRRRSCAPAPAGLDRRAIVWSPKRSLEAVGKCEMHSSIVDGCPGRVAVGCVR
jgi:hypothetical protein